MFKVTKNIAKNKNSLADLVKTGKVTAQSQTTDKWSPLIDSLISTRLHCITTALNL